MAQNTAALSAEQEAPPRVSEWKRFQRVFFQRRLVLFGLVVLAIMLFLAITANWVAPYDPYKLDMANGSLLQPNAQHWLGTDLFGRDELSRLIYGTRSAFEVGFITVALAAVVGMSLGIISGYFGGVIGMLIMRFMDALMGFPMIILAMVISAVLGAGLQNVIIALMVATIPGYARVMNALTLSIRENDYIMAEKSIGSSNARTMLRHILPNAMPPMIVLVTLQLGSLILAEAALSFLGIGIKPPGAAWGAMVNDGYRYMLTNPVLSFAPGLAIMLIVFAFNMVGDGLRDALDPRLRGTM
jgi:peptide/nickel transport system permease protein